MVLRFFPIYSSDRSTLTLQQTKAKQSTPMEDFAEPEKPKKKRKVEEPASTAEQSRSSVPLLFFFLCHSPFVNSVISHSDKIRSEIETVQASLRALKKRSSTSSASEDSTAPSNKKEKRSGDGVSFLAAQRAAYLDSGKAAKLRRSEAAASTTTKKKKEGDEALIESLNQFKDELREARKLALAEEKARTKSVEELEREKQPWGYSGEVLEQEEEEDDNDMSFMTHKLVFKKDAVGLSLFN